MKLDPTLSIQFQRGEQQTVAQLRLQIAPYQLNMGGWTEVSYGSRWLCDENDGIMQGEVPGDLTSELHGYITVNAPLKFTKCLKKIREGRYNIRDEGELLQHAAKMLCLSDYKPRPHFEDDPYIYARLLLKHGVPVEPEIKESRLNLFDPTPPMHVALKKDNSGLVELFMQYGYRLARSDLFLAVQHSAEKSCIALMNWASFISSIQEAADLFYAAAEFRLLGLMRIMIYNNPQYLQQDWVFWDEPPEMQTLPHELHTLRKPQMLQFWAWMQKERRQPAALSDLCRRTVLERLSASIKQKCVKQKQRKKKPTFYQAHLPAAINELSTIAKDLRKMLQIPDVQDIQDIMKDTGINDYTL